MQAIILAAGMGKRLGELTQNNTKCMVKVNGVTLIDRMLHQIERQNLSRIVIVVGYEGQKLIDYIATLDIRTPISYINNPIYDKTNNIYSLALAKDCLMEEDTLLFESDLIFEDAVLDALIKDPRETLALVDKYESWMDGTCVKLNEDDTIGAFVPGKKFKFDEIRDYYKTVNIYKFSKEFSKLYYVPFLDAYQKALGLNEYYEQVLRVITMLDAPVIKAKRLNGQRWYEIDDIQDLDIAESIFTPDEDERIRLLKIRRGGYWRYPKILDFCSLINHFFPPKRMKDEIRANFDTLLTDSPSDIRIDRLLVSKNFGIHLDNIVVGNEIDSLACDLMKYLDGKSGVVNKSADELPAWIDRENIESFIPSDKDGLYTANDIMDRFSDKGIKNLILVNPDHSGNYIEKKELNDLIGWCRDKEMRIIVDESLVDFLDEEASLIDQKLIDENDHLYVLKSISSSRGVLGLRLGILVSGDKDGIESIAADMADLRIDSFGEFYLQIEEKYKKDYAAAITALKDERKRFCEKLSQVKGIEALLPQADYIVLRLGDGISQRELNNRLFIKHNILVKDLSSDNGIFLRLTVRSREDNDIFINALNEELKAQ